MGGFSYTARMVRLDVASVAELISLSKCSLSSGGLLLSPSGRSYRRSLFTSKLMIVNLPERASSQRENHLRMEFSLSISHIQA